MDDKSWDKLADRKKYFEEISSPFAHLTTERKLKNAIKKFSGNKKVVELGAGLGYLVPFLSKHFSQVVAVDFSKKMISQINNRIKKLENVKTRVADMRDLSEFRNEFDVAISVNSIIAPSVKQVNKILGQVHNSLKRSGVFIGVLPSMNSYIHTSLLVYEDYLNKNSKRARRQTASHIEEHKYDFISGIFNNDGKQKFFYDSEIPFRFSNAGFKKVEISRLEYPWYSLKYREIYFPGELKPWDWLVVARK